MSHRTPRESPTLATVSSLSDNSAIKQVVPGKNRRQWEAKQIYGVCMCVWIYIHVSLNVYQENVLPVDNGREGLKWEVLPSLRLGTGFS